jgi:hypothetical protein
MSPERVANTFAADLLMPKYLFAPTARAYPKLNFQTARDLAGVFRTSLLATAIRLVDLGHAPALLVCHSTTGRKWFTRGPDVPSRWFPRDNLDADSFAFGLLFGNEPDDTMPRRIGADAWFDRWEAQKYDVHEQSVRTADDEVLTIVLITDARMLEDRE